MGVSRPHSRILLILGLVFAASFDAGASVWEKARSQACLTVFERQSERFAGLWHRVEETIARFKLGDRLERFDFSIYDESHARFVANPGSLPEYGLLEENLAFWEAELGRLGVGVGIGDLLRNGDARTRYQVLSAFAKSGDLEKGLVERRTRALLEELFVLRKTRIGPRFWELFAPSARGRIRAAFRSRMEYEFVSQSLTARLTDLGVMDSGSRKKLVALVRSPAFQTALSLASHIQVASGYLGFLPRIEFFRVSPELMEKVAVDGFEKHWAEIEATLLPAYRKQTYYDAVRKAYGYVALTVTSIVAYDAYQRTISAESKNADVEGKELIRRLDESNRELEEEIRRLQKLAEQ